MRVITAFILVLSIALSWFMFDRNRPTPWETYAGVAGQSGWKTNVVKSDPKDDGPDGANLHDWDGDGDLDLFVNYEEGGYSRLFFNPGRELVRQEWPEFIEFQHGSSEDSGIGDLDNDGDIDYVATGGLVFFNPGEADVHQTDKWTTMVLLDTQARTPTVGDIDGDGLADLVVEAGTWFKQPALDKHNAENWKRHRFGETEWPMNSFIYDMDKDGDRDVVVQDRRQETFWFVNPGVTQSGANWERETLYPNKGSTFMALGDIDGDGRDDFVITGGKTGKLKGKLVVLLRSNDKGAPETTEVILDQPESPLSGRTNYYPKGVALMDIEGDRNQKEIIIIPKTGDLWYAVFDEDPTRPENWRTIPLTMPGSETRKKMDNAYLGDLDGDGDLDIVTTEEHGGWGVVWFENPANH